MHRQFPLLVLVILTLSSVFYANKVFAWGRDGHNVVGAIALDQVNDSARALLDELGADSRRALSKACNWPDQIRDDDSWDWAAPMHYVNLPRYDRHYDRERDCRSGVCVTEGIKRYASQLADNRLERDKRWQALAWLCHLVGDLHQPLHAGFRDDRGGNSVDVNYQGRTYNLHRLWDTTLIRDQNWSWRRLTKKLLKRLPDMPADTWQPEQADTWTEASSQLVRSVVYPKKVKISSRYVQQAYPLIEIQLSKAGQRLAWILNSIAQTAAEQ